MSHELRTPISALQAVLENLVDGVSDPNPGELRTALAQTERLGRLVGDLLDLSRVEEGVTPLRVKEVRVIDIFDDAVAQARADGVRYEFDVRPVDLTVAADPDRLHQLLANLLDNAARHSPAGGEVSSAPSDWATTSSLPLPTRDRIAAADAARCSSGSPRAPLTAAAPVSGWRSPAGSPSRTGAPSRSRTVNAAAASR